MSKAKTNLFMQKFLIMSMKQTNRYKVVEWNWDEKSLGILFFAILAFVFHYFALLFGYNYLSFIFMYLFLSLMLIGIFWAWFTAEIYWSWLQ